MKKLYESSYFDKKSWILEYFDKLNLTSNETLLLLLIEFCHENNYQESMDYFSKKMNISLEELDSILMNLVNKKYVTLNTNGYSFSINNVFEFDPSKYEVANNRGTFEIFEEFLNRPLSGDELNKISNLIDEYGENELIDALRKAEAYNKHSLSYIESVLLNDSKSFKEDN